jgi:carbonic anhydrase
VGFNGMKLSSWLGLACLALASLPSLAHEDVADDERAQLRGVVRNLMDDNATFVKSHRPDYFKAFQDKQQPRATVVTCADSRVHMQAFDRTPDGDLFVVRNIGNQIATSEGSVEYGVRELHTPLLIVIGHSACGAIKAAYSKDTDTAPAIKRELATLKLPPRNPKQDADEQWISGVQTNVNLQVTFALNKFDAEVSAGKLTIIGAVYDFQNVLKQGQGRLVITNINGKTDAGSIMAALMSFSGASLKLDKQPTKASFTKKSD